MKQDCSDCNGKGATALLTTKREIYDHEPCQRCAGTGALIICPYCGAEYAALDDMESIGVINNECPECCNKLDGNPSELDLAEIRMLRLAESCATLTQDLVDAFKKVIECRKEG